MNTLFKIFRLSLQKFSPFKKFTVYLYSCEYTHGDLCDMCGKECLSPFDPEQRKGLNFKDFILDTIGLCYF